MPVYKVEEPLLEITVESTNKDQFKKAIKELEYIFRAIGAYKKRTPVEKRYVGTSETGRKIFRYSTKFYLSTAGDMGKKVMRILSNMRDRNKGFILRGKTYYLPSDIEIKARVVTEKEEVVSLKTIGGRIQMPKELLEEELSRRANMSRMTMIARSDKPAILKKFVKKYREDIEARGCMIGRLEFYKCHGPINIYQVVEGYRFESDFVVKPQTLTEVYIFLPVSTKGLTYAKKAIVVRSVPLYEIFEEFKNMVRAVPEVARYLGKVKDYRQLKEIAPDVAERLVRTGAWETFDKANAYYHRYARHSDMIIRVVSERPMEAKNAFVRIYLDGEALNEGTPLRVPAQVKVWRVPAVDEAGNPIVHRVSVVTSRYIVSRNVEHEYYSALIWVMANEKCYIFSKNLEKKNPGKIKVISGQYTELNDTNCKQIGVG